MEENTTEKKAGSKKKRLVIFGTVAAVAAILGITFWIKSMGHESTDNAQIDAMITPIRNIVPGYVVDIRFEDNQRVKKGDTLIVIDDRDYKAKVAQAEAALENAKAQLVMAESGANSAESNASASSFSSEAAKANITTAQARFDKNQKDLKRIENMLKDGAATQQQYDAAKAEFETSKAQLDMLNKQFDASSSQAAGAHSQVSAQKAQILLAKAVVKQREAELELAKTQLENTRIRAPFDGIVSKKVIEIDQYLQAGSPICSAVDDGTIWITANFKETQIEKMRPGQDVEVVLDAFPHSTIIGKVESFGGATGAKFSLLPPDNATGNFVKITQRVPVRIKISSYPDELKGMLIPGLSAVVDVHVK